MAMMKLLQRWKNRTHKNIEWLYLDNRDVNDVYFFFLSTGNCTINIFKIILLFNYSCLHFPPTSATPTSLPCFHPPPWFCPCVLYSSSWKPFSPFFPPHSPLAIIRLFLISMSLVIFCLLFSFADYVPVKGEIIWYLSLTGKVISWQDKSKRKKLYRAI